MDMIESTLLETSYGPVDLAHCPAVLLEEIALLGDAEPFASHRGCPDRIRSLVAGFEPEALRWRPAPGEWSVVEVVAHLVQTELVYGYRYRRIVSEPGEPIRGYDQELWIDALPDAEQPIDELLAQLAGLKALNTAFLERLTAEERARWGLHSERGPESVAALIGAMAGHDLLHERQIADNLVAWRERAPGPGV
jgi:hypothetical protein